MKALYIGSVLLGGMLTWSCGAPTETSDTKIYGGTKVAKGGWPSTVAVTGWLTGMRCSGTAVAPNLVITAAHCVDGYSAGGTYVYTGEGAWFGLAKGQYKASKVGHVPNWGEKEGDEGWNDIGYIKLEKPLDLAPNDYVKILVDDDEKAELLVPGGISRIVGYGNRETGGFGTKFEADAKITALNDSEIYIGGDNKVLEALSDRFQFIVITHNRRTMEVLDQLYGVTMQEGGVSTVVGVDMKKDLPAHLQKAFKTEKVAAEAAGEL